MAELELINVGLTTLPSFWPDSNNSKSCLCAVEIRRCEQLTSLATGLLQHHPLDIEHLAIGDCKELVNLLTGLQHLFLKTLTIRKCPKLVQAPADLPIKGERFTLTINELNVDDPLLLLTEPLRNLTSVRSLEINDCSGLDSLAGHMETWLLQNCTSLEKVFLQKAVSLQSLPPSIQALTSLRHLWLYHLDKPSSLPQLPLSLESLTIRGCNDTLKERCRSDVGADWPNIKHIPRINIC